MKKDPLKLIPASYSRIKDYDRCPFYAYEVHVNRNRSEPGLAMERGTQIHKLAEDYVNARVAGKRGMPPQAIALYKAEFHGVVKASHVPPQTELKFGLTSDWQPTEFFGRDVWLRGVWDLVVLSSAWVKVVDHKTGQVYPETTDQLRLYAVAALAWQPLAPHAVAEAWHLDLGPDRGLHRFEVDRPQSRAIMADFTKRIIKMSKDKKLPATPNARCRWCHLAKSKGGPCPENT